MRRRECVTTVDVHDTIHDVRDKRSRRMDVKRSRHRLGVTVPSSDTPPVRLTYLIPSIQSAYVKRSNFIVYG